MKILLLGNSGQLGWELNRSLLPLGDLTAMDYPEIDMADAESIREVVERVKPDLVVNATAYTDVDGAEHEADKAMAINASGVGVLAEAASRIKAGIIHYSTDYVFNGEKGSPYLETDAPDPINVYGRSKLEGELAVQAHEVPQLILRTSWVYSLRRPSFATKVLGWARQQEVLRVVDDQVGNPTWARMLAEITAQVIAGGRGDTLGWLQEKGGVYHLAGGGHCSRFEWAKALLELDPLKGKQATKRIEPARSEAFPTPAQRPRFSALECSLFESVFSLQLPHWKRVMEIPGFFDLIT